MSRINICTLFNLCNSLPRQLIFNSELLLIDNIRCHLLLISFVDSLLRFQPRVAKWRRRAPRSAYNNDILTSVEYDIQCYVRTNQGIRGGVAQGSQVRVKQACLYTSIVCKDDRCMTNTYRAISIPDHKIPIAFLWGSIYTYYSMSIMCSTKSAFKCTDLHSYEICLICQPESLINMTARSGYTCIYIYIYIRISNTRFPCPVLRVRRSPMAYKTFISLDRGSVRAHFWRSFFSIAGKAAVQARHSFRSTGVALELIFAVHF